MEIIEFENKYYLPGLNAAVIESDSIEMFLTPDEPIERGDVKIAPWGANNNLPAEVMKKVRRADVVQSSLLVNILMAIARGFKPMLKKFDDNGKPYYVDLNPDNAAEQIVLDFWEKNDLDGYFLEQVTDLSTFYNVFPEVILSKDGEKITSLRHKEAVFSRYGSVEDNCGRITKHYYWADWLQVDFDKLKKTESTVADRYDPVASIKASYKKNNNDCRYIIPVSFPTPGKGYYQHPYWWSIFESGWYDFLIMIPEIKKALLKNQLGLRYIIYLHKNYWNDRMKSEHIDPSDEEAVKAFKKTELEKFQTFATGKGSSGKGLVALKDYVATAGGVSEQKYIEIVPMPSTVKDGELFTDSEEVTAIISSAMQVNISMVGTAPGKNKSSMSGTDARERYLMKQAMLTPFVKRLFRPLMVVKEYNGWPKNLVIMNSQVEFTTTDINKSGQQVNETE